LTIYGALDNNGGFYSAGLATAWITAFHNGAVASGDLTGNVTIGTLTNAGGGSSAPFCPATRRRRQRARRPSPNSAPSHLERVEEVLESAIPPGFEGKERANIGQDESIRLDVVRARFRLIVTIRPK